MLPSVGHLLSRRVRLVAGLVFLTLAFTTVAAKNAPPAVAQMDTATATGDNLILDDFSAVNINVDAHSGPSGENPGGTVSFELWLNVLTGADVPPISGPVTCLNVNGNIAVITVSGPFPSNPGIPGFLVKLTDNGGSGQDRFEYFPTAIDPSMTPLDCITGSPAYFGAPLIGRAVVFDAQPAAPTSKEQCKHGGFAQFGFRNQGECVKSVKDQT